MPKYTYKCTECDTIVVKYHGMKDRAHDCAQCNKEGSLRRVMTRISLQDRAINDKKPVGSVVKKFIEDAREEIETEKRERNSDKLD